MKCPKCRDSNSSGETVCRSCGMPLGSLVQKDKIPEKVQELSPSSVNDPGGAAPGYWGRAPEEDQEEKGKEKEKIQRINEAEETEKDARRNDIEWEIKPFSEKYDLLIKQMAEEAKNISFIVSGATEGDSVKVMTEYEKSSVAVFLKNRPNQLTENGLMSTPEAIGDLIAVYESVKDQIEPRYTGAISTVEWCLSIFRQMEMHITAPSRTRN